MAAMSTGLEGEGWRQRDHDKAIIMSWLEAMRAGLTKDGVMGKSGGSPRETYKMMTMGVPEHTTAVNATCLRFFYSLNRDLKEVREPPSQLHP